MRAHSGGGGSGSADGARSEVRSRLRGHLIRRGFTLEEMDFSELFGKGGGPRCLVNDLRGLVVNPGAPSYANLRESLYAKMERYPELVEPEAPPSAPVTPAS